MNEFKKEIQWRAVRHNTIQVSLEQVWFSFIDNYHIWTARRRWIHESVHPYWCRPRLVHFMSESIRERFDHLFIHSTAAVSLFHTHTFTYIHTTHIINRYEANIIHRNQHVIKKQKQVSKTQHLWSVPYTEKKQNGSPK